MLRFKPVLLLFAGLCVFAAPSLADTTFTDGTFNPADYTATSYISSGTIGISSGQCASCGDPIGPGNTALQVIFNFTQPVAGGVAVLGLVNSTFSYNPGTQGAIISIDASVDKNVILSVPANPSNTFGNTFWPLIEQDGVIYLSPISGPNFDGGTTGYLPLSQSGLVAGDFFAFNFITGAFNLAASPNFSGDPMLFGVAQVTEYNGVITDESDYDNLSYTIATPEPSSFLLLGLGLAGLALVSRRRLRSN
jgi:PEP-CTERM motif